MKCSQLGNECPADCPPRADWIEFVSFLDICELVQINGFPISRTPLPFLIPCCFPLPPGIPRLLRPSSSDCTCRSVRHKVTEVNQRIAIHSPFWPRRISSLQQPLPASSIRQFLHAIPLHIRSIQSDCWAMLQAFSDGGASRISLRR
jgi:hypothetical protein